ncbi:transposase [Candidatus Saccharibacteria bacterium]|nr:transposase [Candidatus Saccharibacteria bacterium]
MPGRNVNKIYLEESYYHVYGRGHNKGVVFRDDDDYAVFLNLFKRYLSNKPVQDKKGREYPWLQKEVDLLVFCLMPNHFHALIYQRNSDAMTKLFKSVITTYGMYFNKKYKCVGPVFQGRFKASMIDRDNYLMHISRYIHLNPKNYERWAFSSLPFYLGRQKAEWLKPDSILEFFDGRIDYRKFVEDYENHKKMFDEIKEELANY